MTRPPRWHVDAPSWAVLAARFVLGAVFAVAVVAGWKVASRWFGVDPGQQLGVGGDCDEGSGWAGGASRAVDPGAVVVPDVRTPAKPPRSGTRWTIEDDAYVAAHLNDSPEALARHLGRTPAAVHQRRAILRQHEVS